MKVRDVCETVVSELRITFDEDPHRGSIDDRDKHQQQEVSGWCQILLWRLTQIKQRHG